MCAPAPSFSPFTTVGAFSQHAPPPTHDLTFHFIFFYSPSSLPIANDSIPPTHPLPAQIIVGSMAREAPSPLLQSALWVAIALAAAGTASAPGRPLAALLPPHVLARAAHAFLGAAAALHLSFATGAVGEIARALGIRAFAIGPRQALQGGQAAEVARAQVAEIAEGGAAGGSGEAEGIAAVDDGPAAGPEVAHVRRRAPRAIKGESAGAGARTAGRSASKPRSRSRSTRRKAQ